MEKITIQRYDRDPGVGPMEIEPTFEAILKLLKCKVTDLTVTISTNHTLRIENRYDEGIFISSEDFRKLLPAIEMSEDKEKEGWVSSDSFELTNDDYDLELADHAAGCRLLPRPCLTIERMTAIFGAPNPTSYYLPDYGLEGFEWAFTSDEDLGCVVFFQLGEPLIRYEDGFDKEVFLIWLLKKLE